MNEWAKIFISKNRSFILQNFSVLSFDNVNILLREF